MTRRALLIGINYRGTSSELNGCINDVEHMMKFLETKGYRDFTVLTDDTSIKPTRANILRCLLDLILSGASQLFVHYSGHGSYTYDRDGSEKDRRDETLVPLDYASAGMIIDDELRGILQCATRRQKITCILDCCHSGTGMDLAYGLYERSGGTRLSMVRDRKMKKTPARIIMLSGCKDPQTSADAWEDSKYQGAMSWAFLECIKKCKTWSSLLTSIRSQLKSGGYSQIPMLTSGQSLSLRSSVSI